MSSDLISNHDDSHTGLPLFKSKFELRLFIDRVKENYKPEVVDYKEDENIVFKVPNFLN